MGCGLLPYLGCCINIGVHVSFQISMLIFSGYMPKSGTAGSYGSSLFTFWGASVLFPQRLHQFTFLSTVDKCSLSSTSAPAFATCRLFDSHSDRCEVISPCLDLHFCVYWGDQVICIFPFGKCITRLIWEHWAILCPCRINLAWSWGMILFIYCWIPFANILLNIFASIFIRDIDL